MIPNEYLPISHISQPIPDKISPSSQSLMSRIKVVFDVGFEIESDSTESMAEVPGSFIKIRSWNLIFPS